MVRTLAAPRAQVASAGARVPLRCRRGYANPLAALHQHVSRADRSPVPRQHPINLLASAVPRLGTSRSRRAWPRRMPYPGRPTRGDAPISQPIPHPRHGTEGPAPRHEPARPGHGPVGIPYPGRPTRGDVHPQSGRFQPGPRHWTEPGRPGWPHYRADRPGFYPGFHQGGGRRWVWDRRRWIERGRRWPWLYRQGWVGAPPDETIRWAQACLARLLGPGVPQDGTPR